MGYSIHTLSHVSNVLNCIAVMIFQLSLKYFCEVNSLNIADLHFYINVKSEGGKILSRTHPRAALNKHIHIEAYRSTVSYSTAAIHMYWNGSDVQVIKLL